MYLNPVGLAFAIFFSSLPLSLHWRRPSCQSHNMGTTCQPEAARLEAVHMLGTLLAPPLRELCREAHAHFCTTHVSINLVDEEEVRQQALAGQPGPASNRRDASISADVIVDEDKRGDTFGVLVVLDIASDARCASKATREGFYAGAASRYSHGGGAQSVGTLWYPSSFTILIVYLLLLHFLCTRSTSRQ